MSSNSNTSNGVSLGTVLFLIFLMLKLTDKIDWSWWWVTSPLWIPVALGLSILVLAFLLVIVALSFGMSIDEIKEKAQKYKK